MPSSLFPPFVTTLRWRVTGLLLAIIVAAMGISGFLISDAVARAYLKEREIFLLARTNTISTAVAALSPDRGLERAALVRRYAWEAGGRVLLISTVGKVIFDSAGAGELEGVELEHLEVHQALGGTSAVRLHHLAGEGWVVYTAVPLIRNKAVQGAVLLSTPAGDILERVRAVERLILTASGVAAILAGLLGLQVAVSLTRPLDRLKRATEAMSGGDLTARAQVKGNDEVGRLGAAFNTMAARLEAVDRTRREFIANASHELRTPLSTSKVLLDSLPEDPDSDPALYREVVNDVRSEIQRLAALVNSLLELARLEEPGVTPDLRPGDLVEVARGVAGSLAPLAQARNIDIRVTADGSVAAPFDERLVFSALYNLVDNALKYSPPGGRVEVRVKFNPVSRTGLSGWARVEVADAGPGISPELRERIFDRFVRSDEARSRAAGGAGLGLSITREIARLHHGRVGVLAGGEGGSVFYLELPASG